MHGILKSKKKLRTWIGKTVKLIVKRGKKCVRKLKGKPPKLSPWQIIELLA